MSLLDFDRQFLKNPSGLIGIDETGRGALVGAVYAATVWTSEKFYQSPEVAQKVALINDSKKLTPALRESIYAQIKSWASQGLIQYSFAQASVPEIEELNIFGATQLAMKRSLENLNSKIPHQVSPLSSFPLFQNTSSSPPPQILIDGIPLKKFPYDHQAIVSGDSQSLVIAMASIVAKVERDYYMKKLDQLYPQYSFATHKGYGTKTHREAIQVHGPSPEHRTLFIRNILSALPSANSI